MTNDENDESRGRGDQPSFDLEERTAKLGEAVIEFCRRVPEGQRN